MAGEYSNSNTVAHIDILFGSNVKHTRVNVDCVVRKCNKQICMRNVSMSTLCKSCAAIL